MSLNIHLKPERKYFFLGKQGKTMNQADQCAAITLNLQKEKAFFISCLHFYGWEENK